MPVPPIDMPVGSRWGKLTIIAPTTCTRAGFHWLCKCDCGNFKAVRGSAMRTGDTVSCGCVKKQALNRRTHGMRRTPEWKAWDSAIQRTSNPNIKGYANYGGRGIKMCDRWLHSFEAFYSDMGKRPTKKHSLDRYPDQNGPYAPDNCRWATWTEQANNKRNNRLITVDGRTMTLPEWSRESGLSQSCLWHRVISGCPETEILRPAKAVRHSVAA